MADLTKIDQALLNNALTARDASLQKSLSSEDSSILLALLDSLTRRYPMQDQAESVEEYFKDFEQLAIRKGIEKVQEAIQSLRIDPEQEFFPRPNEIAAEMERLRLKKVPSHIYARG